MLQELAGEIAQRSGADLRPIALAGPAAGAAIGGRRTSTACSSGCRRRSTSSARWRPTPRTSCARRWRRPGCGCRPRSTHDLRRDDVAGGARRAADARPPHREAAAAVACRVGRLARARSRSTWSSSPARWRRSSGATEPTRAPARPEGAGHRACRWRCGDVDALAIALRNLVENALRYSRDAASTIEVMRPVHAGRARLRSGRRRLERCETLQQRHVRHSADAPATGWACRSSAPSSTSTAAGSS